MNNKMIRNLFPIMLAFFLVFGMFSVTVLAAFPDLEFTMVQGTTVSKAKLLIDDTAYDEYNNLLKFSNDLAASTYAENHDMSSIGITVTNDNEFPAALKVGSYMNLYEIDASNLLVNRGSIQINNSHLHPPTPGTTAISGGEGKITVSGYQAVSDCKLYLVPESLYPSPDGAIAITDARVIEITDNGDIVCNAGKYWFYTVYIGYYAGVGHGSYDAGSEVTVTAANDVCEIGGTGYATLAEALAAVGDGQTVIIKLLQNITYNGGIDISTNQNKRITFDLNGFTLNVINTEGPGLLLYSGGIDYIDNTANLGQFNVTGTTHGVRAWWGGTIVKVTNATATALSQNNDSESYGVYARYGAEIQVAQNAQGNKYGAYSDSAYSGYRSKVVIDGNAIAENVSIANNPRTGAIATNYADIEVGGTASGGWHGVYAGSTSTAKVGGNATGGMYGAYAELTSSVEVTGNVEATENYGMGAYNLSSNSTITVGGNSITSISTGIGAVANEGSITIDGTINAAATTYVRVGSTNKNAGEYTTDVSKPGYRKYSEGTGTGTVWVKDTTATANVCAIGVTEYPTLTDALANVPTGGASPTTIKLLTNITHNEPIYINNKHITFDLNGKNLIIDTSAATGSTALGIVEAGSVDYIGSGEFNVIGADCGVAARDADSTATVTNATATGFDGNGVLASHNATVIVKGNVVFSGNCDNDNDAGYGISLVAGGSVTVNGGVTASGTDSQGIGATNGTVVVDGDVTAAKRGIYTYNTANITVHGNVTAISSNSVGVEAGGSSVVNIGGNVTASGTNSIAVYANNFSGASGASGGTVTIGGKVQSDYLGVHATDGGTVNINGVLATSPIAYIKVGTTIKASDDYEQITTLTGYYTYTDNTSTVWVKKTPDVVSPTVPQNFNATSGNGQVALSWTASMNNGGAAIIRYEVSSNNGGTWITASSSSSHTFTGLTNDTAYIFKVRAVNSAGNGVEASVTATPNSGNIIGGGGGSYTPLQPLTIVVESLPNMPTSATVSLIKKPSSNGLLTEVINEQMVAEAFAKGEAESKRLGRQNLGISIGFRNGESGVKNLSVKFDEAAIKRLKSSNVEFCEVNTGIFYFILDKEAISELSSQTQGTVIFTVAPVTKLSNTASTAIGSRPVFNFTVKDSSGKSVTSYGKGIITRGIKYSALSGEKTDHLFVVKVTDDMVQWINESSYGNGWMIWSSNSNSVYGVGYIENPQMFTDIPVFKDTTVHWGKDNIDFVASRGLLTGTGAATFSPDTVITRAMFITALGRLSGQDMSVYTTSSFTDVAAGSYYLPYVEWAVNNKIVCGTGGGNFSPESSITREDMAVMMQNYAQATGYTMPVFREKITFSDAASISSYAQEAVTAIQQAGIIVGRGNNQFVPQASATRAEAATILRNFVETVIEG